VSDPDRVYHVELKSFPHIARAFNLDRETLDARFVKPWSTGELIDYDDRRWAPEKTKLVVLEGPYLDRTERGLGRGWGEATRHAENVTDRVVAEIQRGADAAPEVQALKAALAEVAAREDGIGFPDVIVLAGAAHPGWRASEQLSLAEQAVWEMLHRGGLVMISAAGRPLDAAQWQDVVLGWTTWASAGEPGPRLRVP
jgi:hypothetical protein